MLHEIEKSSEKSQNMNENANILQERVQTSNEISMKKEKKSTKSSVQELKIPVVGYCRVSTDNQREEGTVELQKSALLEHCKGNFELREIFADEGVSGGLENRPALISMFEYLENNPMIKNVLIWKLDRLARDLYIQEHLIKKLEAMGIALLSIKEPNLDSNDPMRKAFRQFMGIVAELEKSFITMRLREGRKAKAKKGKYSGGGLAYGYKSKDKDFSIDTQQALTVQDIYKMRIHRHYSFNKIANILNEQGTPTMQGKKWNPGTVHYMIHNKKYRGIIQYSSESAHRPDLAII